MTTGDCSEFSPAKYLDNPRHEATTRDDPGRHVGYGPDSHIHVWPGSLAQPVDGNRRPAVVRGGRGIRVAVIDTGLADHPWLEGRRAVGSHPEMDHGVGCFSPAYGHGTFVAGVVHRYAGDASILGRQVPISHGQVAARDMVTAIRAVVTFRPDVVNLSFGVDLHEPNDQDDLDAAIAELVRANRGVVVVAAAGNQGWTSPVYPAALPGVIAVGAVGRDGQRAVRDLDQPYPFDHWESNYGEWLSVGAVGVDVVSCFPKPPDGLVRCDCRRSEEFFDDGFATWEGTSFAAPAISGAIAHRAAERKVSAADALRSLIEEPGTPVADGIGPVPKLPGVGS